MQNNIMRESYTGLFGYWPQAFTAIIEGTVPENDKDFNIVVGKLFDYRLAGQKVPENLLRNFSDRQQMINDFKQIYLSSKTLQSQSDRISFILNSVFMQGLRNISEGTDLTADDEDYIRNTSSVAAFRAIKRDDFLDNSELKDYLVSYSYAITTHEAIKYNVLAYKGFSPKQIEKLSKQREKISVAWTNCLKAEKITKADVFALWQKVQNLKNISAPYTEELFQSNLHPVILEAFKGYIKLRDKFPEDRQRAYSKAIASNITKYYTAVFQEDPKKKLNTGDYAS